MFILTRKVDETVVIGDSIEITLVAIQYSQGQVRLGINAPRSVGVYRKELLQEITQENVRAAATPSPDQLSAHLALPPKPE